ATHKKAKAAAEAEPQRRVERRKQIRTRMAEVQQALVALPKPAEQSTSVDHPLAHNAVRAELAAHRFALTREAPALESELVKFDSEDAADLLRLQIDLNTRQVSQTQRRLQLVKDQIHAARAAAAEQSVRKARFEAIAAVPSLKSYAERNHELAEIAQQTAARLDDAEEDVKASKALYEKLLQQFESTKTKVETVGLTSSIGAMLRQQRALLPDVGDRLAAVGSRKELIDETQYEKFEFEDERQELADPQALLARMLADAEANGGHDREVLRVAAQELLDHKRTYLDDLIRAATSYFDALIELDTTDSQIIALSQQYQQYIDERVLWIRSGKVLTSDLQLDPADSWFLSVARWQEVGDCFWKDLRYHPVLYALATLMLLVLVARGRRLRNELFDLGETAQRANCRSIEPTLRAFACSLLIAIVWPGVCGFCAWRLSLAGPAAPFAMAIGHGLWCVSLLWFSLELFRQFCRQQGLAEAHFAWPASATKSIRAELRWFTLLALPFALVTATLFASDPTHGRDTVERSVFIGGVILLVIFLYRLLRPTRGALREYVAYHPEGWVGRLKNVWVALGVAMPIALAGLAFAGYYYTAQVLSWKLYATLCFVVAVVVGRAFLMRLLLLRRRNLSIEQSRQRAIDAHRASEPDSANPIAGIVTEQPQADLAAHSQQTQRLLNSGFFAASIVGVWLIWVQVLPALSMLDEYPVWNTSSGLNSLAASPTPTAGPQASLASGGTRSSSEAYQSEQVVTLSDVAFALLIVVVTVVAARNGPGLLEIAVLQKLPVDASIRYATTTLVSYAIILIGAISACSTIGLQWSQIQWLATALTFGLAFGLQEIFANFVAGLIILLERPIRVGDVVTIDDVTGVVSRIRIRATSITNWDRKEYVVPNKEFITGRLLNWTLSDKTNRIVINVGVAYGSDTELARELLLRVANDHPLVLKDPPSLATFEGFGDNSLNMTLRTFLPTMEDRLEVIHQLHTAIDQAFRKAGLEIAFPQRDLHIRSTPTALASLLDGDQKHADPRDEAA
ncbi:MAG: mechanosensitive ion channel domain-containing protein, partial [Planctomycetota bacterium]